jgi:hypothetical protein
MRPPNHHKLSVRQGLGLALLLLWFFGGLALFYVIQKPFTPAAAAALAGAALNLLAAGWLGLLGLGLGHRLLVWLGLLASRVGKGAGSFEMSTGEALVLGSGLGLGVLGLLALALGLAGLFYGWLFLALSLALTAWLWPDFRALRRSWASRQIVERPHPLTALYVAAVGLAAVVLALLPPADMDGLFYHLTAPKLFIQSHAIRPGLDVPHFNFPLLAEMLFSYAMLLANDIAAKLIHTLYGFLLAGLVYLTASRCLSRAAAWPAVLVLLSMPMVALLAGWAYNDLALAFYQLAAVYALLRSRPEAPEGEFHPRWLLLSGLLAGLAMGLKYTGFVTPLLIGLILAWRLVKSGRFYQNLRLLLYFAIPAGLVALPWYLKNLAFTGNPVYPFLFEGLFWDKFRAEWYAQSGTGLGFDPLTWLQLPALAMLGTRDVNYFDGRTGPLFLLFLPLLVVYGLLRYRARVPERPAALDVLLLAGLAQFLFWALGVIWSNSLWQSRLLLPGLAALSPVVAWLWLDLAHLDRPGFSVRRFVNLLVGLVLALSLVELGLGLVGLNPLAYLTGLESRDDYLTRRLGAYYAAMEQMNETLPAGTGVVFLLEPRSYFCRLDCRPDSILDRLPHDQHRYGSAAEIVAAWKEAGMTHVLLNRQGLNFMKKEDDRGLFRPALEQLAVMESQFFEPVFDVAGAYQLYALR